MLLAAVGVKILGHFSAKKLCKYWINLPVCLVIIIATILPASAVLAATPTSPIRIFHNPIRVDGPIESPGLRAAATPNVVSAPFTPAQIKKAYGVDQIAATGTGKTIAIVVAYGSPTIANDLQVFDTHFSLPAANLTIHNMNGQPALDVGWATETSLDVEWSHALAPSANLLLVVSADSS